MNFGLCLGKGWAATFISDSEILHSDKGSESLERNILKPDIIKTASNEWRWEVLPKYMEVKSLIIKEDTAD
jgi:hypothetical protein